MKRMILLAVVLAMTMGVSGSANATIDWAGNLFPGDGANVLDSGPVDVYVQVYKFDVTDSPGQGAQISATMSYTPEGGSIAFVGITFNTDVGNNDEYTGQIPQAALSGVSYVDLSITFFDESDKTTYGPITARYNVFIAGPLGSPKDVCFQVCMQAVENTGDVCVTGNQDLLTNWGSGVLMYSIGPDLYQACLTFPADAVGPLFLEYKFRKDGCDTYEGVPNRTLVVTAGSDAEQTVRHNFDDSIAICEVIATESTTWGSLKSTYR